MSEVEINPTEPTMSITRLLDAPRELVWQVWTQVEHVDSWWGPDGFSNSTQEMNVAPGGIWKFSMDHGEKGSFPNLIIYKEVVKPEKLTYVHGSDDDASPENFEVEVMFKDVDGKTELTMTSRFSTIEQRDQLIKDVVAAEGLKQTIDNLEDYVKRVR